MTRDTSLRAFLDRLASDRPVRQADLALAAFFDVWAFSPHYRVGLSDEALGEEMRRLMEEACPWDDDREVKPLKPSSGSSARLFWCECSGKGKKCSTLHNPGETHSGETRLLRDTGNRVETSTGALAIEWGLTEAGAVKFQARLRRTA
jgi:hypothetical protein